MIHDVAFRWFVRLSGATSGPETNARARLVQSLARPSAPHVARADARFWVGCPFYRRPQYAALTCGIIRGALHNLGMLSTVTVDVPALPQCACATASDGMPAVGAVLTFLSVLVSPIVSCRTGSFKITANKAV